MPDGLLRLDLSWRVSAYRLAWICVMKVFVDGTKIPVRLFLLAWR